MFAKFRQTCYTVAAAVPDPSQSPKPRWSIADSIDLEFLLRREKSDPDPNAEFFAEEVEPWIEPGKIDRPDAQTLSRAFWRWLQLAKNRVDAANLPGKAISGAFGTVGAVSALLMLLLGAGAVLGTSDREDERTYNVLLLLGITVGIQWLILVLGLLGFLVWSIWREHAFVSFTHRGFQALIDKLARRTMSEEAGQWWEETAKTRGLFTLPALQLAQAAGIAFNLGVLAALIGSVLFDTVRFGWETTAETTMTSALHQSTRILAAPWAWIDPEWAPDRAEIEATRIRWDSGGESMLPEESAAAWYPFVLGTILVWGLLPRLLLFALFDLRRRSALRNQPFAERVHRQWWRNLTDVPIEVTTDGPADDAIALLWGGVSPDEEQLRVAGLQQLRVNLAEMLPAGGAEICDDEAALQAVQRRLKKGALRVVIVVEAWSLAPKDLGDFLDQLRQIAGPATPVDCFILGLPREETALTPPKEDEMAVWEKFAASRNDPALFVKPCREPA